MPKKTQPPFPVAQQNTQASLRGMLSSDQALYERILDTPGFAFHFNQLALRAREGDAAVEHCVCGSMNSDDMRKTWRGSGNARKRTTASRS